MQTMQYGVSENIESEMKIVEMFISKDRETHNWHNEEILVTCLSWTTGKERIVRRFISKPDGTNEERPF